MNSPNRNRIAEARKQAKERLNRKLQFPTEGDIGETKQTYTEVSLGNMKEQE